MSYSSYVAGIRKKIKIIATILFLVVIFCIMGEISGKTALAMTEDSTNTEQTTEEKEYYEYTDEELEVVYLEAELEEQKMKQEISEIKADYESKLKEEWFIEVGENTGIIELQIPEVELSKLDKELYDEVVIQLETTNKAVINGEMIYVAEEDEYYNKGLDEDYVVQGGKNDFKLYSFKVWRLRLYTGWRVWVDSFKTEILVDILTGITILAELGAVLLAVGVITAPGAVPLAVIGLVAGALAFGISMLNKYGNDGIIFGGVYPPTPYLSGTGVPYVWSQ